MTTYVEPDPGALFVPGQLVELRITTLLGASYLFPDVDAAAAVELVQSTIAIGHVLPGQLTLVNASGACLVLPTRIVKRIEVVTDPVRLFWERPT